MDFIELKPPKRYHIADVLASFRHKNKGYKINLRLKDIILVQMGAKIGDRLSVSYAAENPKILFIKKAYVGNKISFTSRILISSPFDIKEDIQSVNIPYEIKEGGIYLYFDEAPELKWENENEFRFRSNVICSRMP